MEGVRWCYIHFYTCCALVFIPQVLGVVEIIEQNTPQLFEVGKIMSLKCISNEQKGLFWTRNSPATNWLEQPINVSKGSGWEERYLTIRPSGYVESILVRRNLQSGDGGSYFCYDRSKEHSFSTFIHVLKVSHKNVTASNSTAVTLTCNLSGFTTNPPKIDHSWVRDDRELVPEARPDKYKISTFMRTTLKLDILKPNKHDTGAYECNFILYQQNDNYVIFSENVYLDADHLESNGNRVWSPAGFLVTLLCLGLCCIFY